MKDVLLVDAVGLEDVKICRSVEQFVKATLIVLRARNKKERLGAGRMEEWEEAGLGGIAGVGQAAEDRVAAHLPTTIQWFASCVKKYASPGLLSAGTGGGADSASIPLKAVGRGSSHPGST